MRVRPLINMVHREKPKIIKQLPNATNHSTQATKMMKMSQNMLPSVTQWYHQNELPSFQKVVQITMLLQSILTSELPNNIKLLPNATKYSTQATKMKMCQNMLPRVTKWYYQNELPSFQKVVQIIMLLQSILTSELLNNIKLLPDAIKHCIKVIK